MFKSIAGARAWPSILFGFCFGANRQVSFFSWSPLGNVVTSMARGSTKFANVALRGTLLPPPLFESALEKHWTCAIFSLTINKTARVTPAAERLAPTNPPPPSTAALSLFLQRFCFGFFVSHFYFVRSFPLCECFIFFHHLGCTHVQTSLFCGSRPWIRSRSVKCRTINTFTLWKMTMADLW